MPQSSLLNYLSTPPTKTIPTLLSHTNQIKIELLRSNSPHLPTSFSNVRDNAQASPPLPVFGARASAGETAQDPPLLTIQSSLISHTPTMALSTVQPGHIPALKRLTSTLLPIKYPDSFFDGAIDDEFAAAFSRVALYSPTSSPIGWIRCRLEPFPEPTSPPSNTKAIYNQIYIQTLCLLAPYRGRGVASALLESILQPGVLLNHNVHFIYAHVWESNEEALEWYKKRGFNLIMMVESYYRKLRPAGAWLVRKDLTSCAS